MIENIFLLVLPAFATGCVVGMLATLLYLFGWHGEKVFGEDEDEIEPILPDKNPADYQYQCDNVDCQKLTNEIDVDTYGYRCPVCLQGIFQDTKENSLETQR